MSIDVQHFDFCADCRIKGFHVLDHSNLQYNRYVELALIPSSVYLLSCKGSAAPALQGNTQDKNQFRDSILHLIKSIEDAKALEGKEVGLSDWVEIDQQKIDRFAKATGDFQWIHVDPDRAKAELPDGKTIAHGYFTLALIPALSGDFIQVENLARAINFGCNKIRFYTPVPVGSRVRCRATVIQARKMSGALHLLSQIKIEVEGERKPACVAETIGMYFLNGA